MSVTPTGGPLRPPPQDAAVHPPDGGPAETTVEPIELQSAELRSSPLSEVADGATLELGAEGPDVRLLQDLLQERGYPTRTPDGVFGRQTQRALTLFQGDEGLPPTGVLDPHTLGVLDFRVALDSGEIELNPGWVPGEPVFGTELRVPEVEVEWTHGVMEELGAEFIPYEWRPESDAVELDGVLYPYQDFVPAAIDRLNRQPVGPALSVPIENVPYLHGAGMGLAPEMLQNPRWREILRELEPDVFAAVKEARRDGRDNFEDLIPMLENNPVMAAYAAVQHGRPATELLDGRAVVGGEREPQPAIEWDVWVDPERAAAWQQEPSRAHLDAIVDSIVIAHGGGISDGVSEKYQLESDNYHDVAARAPWELGGVTPESWLGDFDRALAFSGAVDLGAQLGRTGASEVRPETLGATYSERTGGDRMRLVLDLKSNASYLTPELVGAVAGRLEDRYGLEVAAVASFDPDQLVGTGTDQVLFFHGVGGLQDAIREASADDAARSRLEGRTVMFNGGTLLDPSTRDVRPGVVDGLWEASAGLGLGVGLYVQEDDAPRWAVDALSRVVAENPGLFSYGLAFGGAPDRVAPGISADGTGLGAQSLIASTWIRDEPAAGGYPLDPPSTWGIEPDINAVPPEARSTAEELLAANPYLPIRSNGHWIAVGNEAFDGPEAFLDRADELLRWARRDYGLVQSLVESRGASILVPGSNEFEGSDFDWADLYFGNAYWREP